MISALTFIISSWKSCSHTQPPYTGTVRNPQKAVLGQGASEGCCSNQRWRSPTQASADHMDTGHSLHLLASLPRIKGMSQWIPPAANPSHQKPQSKDTLVTRWAMGGARAYRLALGTDRGGVFPEIFWGWFGYGNVNPPNKNDKD